jgi:hypothetical protein
MNIFKQTESSNRQAEAMEKPLAGKPYASSPQANTFQEASTFSNPSPPHFCNVISLKTLDSNLLLQFGFLHPAQPTSEVTPFPSKSTIVLSSDTAKQLFCALAELFECEVRPRP